VWGSIKSVGISGFLCARLRVKYVYPHGSNLTVQNGTIVEALSLFANNAKEYFKNLNDCAICYGVVGADKTLPTKKCPNGHWFHGICLYRVLSFYLPV